MNCHTGARAGAAAQRCSQRKAARWGEEGDGGAPLVRAGGAQQPASRCLPEIQEVLVDPAIFREESASVLGCSESAERHSHPGVREGRCLFFLPCVVILQV